MVRTLEILMTVLAIAAIIVGIVILKGLWDPATLFGIPTTANQSWGVVLIGTGVAVLAVPYIQKFKK